MFTINGVYEYPGITLQTTNVNDAKNKCMDLCNQSDPASCSVIHLQSYPNSINYICNKGKLKDTVKRQYPNKTVSVLYILNTNLH